jgi:hypothetical protein
MWLFHHRPDCIIITYNGVEVGTIEIKPLDKCNELVSVDKCKVAEICKRQLHLRMRIARTTKEFVTFGMLVAGRRYIMFIPCSFSNCFLIPCLGKRVFFNSLRLDANGIYKYVQHDEVVLPSFASTTTNMEAFLESILSFRVIMIGDFFKHLHY